MAFLNSMLSFLFGENTRKTIEIFCENREAAAGRDEARLNAALNQFSMEFRQANRSGFDRWDQPLASSDDGLWCDRSVLFCDGRS